MEEFKVIYFLYDYILPNGYCPNALETNNFLLNYMNSQYSTGPSDGNAFTDPEHSSVIEDIFHKQLGVWPNSWSGTNLVALEMQMNICQDSVYEGRKKTKHYFYVVKISPHFDQFVAHSVIEYPKTNGNYFWKYMSQTALEDVRSKRATIILDLAQENYIEKDHYENFHKALEFSMIPSTQIILVFNTFNGSQIYNSWFLSCERRLQVLNWPFVMWNSSNYYAKKRSRTANGTSWLNKERTRMRPYYFLFKIKNARVHRKALLYALYAESLLKKADWSYLSDDPFSDNDLASIKKTFNLNYNKDIRLLTKRFPKTLENEPTTTIDNVSAWTDKTTEPYQNSYFYICTETYYHGDHKSLTEKVFKPIGNYQPFLFLAFRHSLAQLKDLGFKTFHPYIDESYDNEHDVAERIKMIVKEVKKLCSMSQNEIHDWHWSMQDILEHNRNHLVNIYKDEPLTKNFITFFHKRSK